MTGKDIEPRQPRTLNITPLPGPDNEPPYLPARPAAGRIGMTRDDRIEGFENRGYDEGGFDAFRDAVRLDHEVTMNRLAIERERIKIQRERHEFAAARREPFIRFAVAMPPIVWLAVLVLGSVLVWALFEWLDEHWREVAAIGGGLTALILLIRHRQRLQDAAQAAHARYASRPVAPPDVYRSTAVNYASIDRLQGDQGAILQGLTPAKQSLYLQAAQRGEVPVTSRPESGRRVIFAKLPGGLITPADVNAERVGHALGVEDPAGQVSILPAPGGQLAIAVLDKAPGGMGVASWPLLGQVTSWCDPLPFAVDTTGNTVAVEFVQADPSGDRSANHLVLAGGTGGGKSSAARIIAAHAAACPDAELRILDLKGAGDWNAFEARGVPVLAGNDPARAVEYLRALDREVDDRNALRSRDRSAFEALPFVVFLLDEVHMLMASTDRNSADEARALVSGMYMKARSAHVHLGIIPQNPVRETFPPSIIGQAKIRIGLGLDRDPMLRNLFGEQTTATPLEGEGQGHGWLQAPGVKLARIRTFYASEADIDRHLQATMTAAPIGAAGTVVTGELAPQDTTATDDQIDVLLDAYRLLCRAPQGVCLAGRHGTVRGIADGIAVPESVLRKALRAAGIKTESHRCQIEGKSVRGLWADDMESALPGVFHEGA